MSNKNKRVLLEPGTMRKNNSQIKGAGLSTLDAALEEQAKCAPCGCDGCKGYTTLTNAETGELMVMYITGSGPYTVNVADYDTGIAAVEALYTARTT